MILVVGSTGNLGRKVVRSLRAAGENVRAMTRVIAKADELKALGAQPIRADLTDPDSLDFALRGVRAVVISAHSVLGRGAESSEEIDDKGHRTLIDKAKEAGVEHIIYISVIGASADHVLDFWRTKARIEQYIKDSGIAYTIIRAASFMEVHAYMLLGQAVVEGKRVMVMGRGKHPRNFVAAEDVAKVVMGALKIPSLRGETIDVGGPENLTSNQVVELFERLTGRKAKVTHIPMPVVKSMARVMKPIHPGISRVMRMSVHDETTDQTFDATLLRSRIPIKLTTLEEWARSRMREA